MRPPMDWRVGDAVRLQLHEVMFIFGSGCLVGHSPIETIIEVLDNEVQDGEEG